MNEVALSWHNSAGGTEALTVPANPVNTPWAKRQLSPVTQGEDLSAGDIDGGGDAEQGKTPPWGRWREAKEENGEVWRRRKFSVCCLSL